NVAQIQNPARDACSCGDGLEGCETRLHQILDFQRKQARHTIGSDRDGYPLTMCLQQVLVPGSDAGFHGRVLSAHPHENIAEMIVPVLVAPSHVVQETPFIEEGLEGDRIRADESLLVLHKQVHQLLGEIIAVLNGIDPSLERQAYRLAVGVGSRLKTQAVRLVYGGWYLV